MPHSLEFDSRQEGFHATSRSDELAGRGPLPEKLHPSCRTPGTSVSGSSPFPGYLVSRDILTGPSLIVRPLEQAPRLFPRISYGRIFGKLQILEPSALARFMGEGPLHAKGTPKPAWARISPKSSGETQALFWPKRPKSHQSARRSVAWGAHGAPQTHVARSAGLGVGERFRRRRNWSCL